MTMAAQHRCTVLVVEDEPDTQEVLRVALEADGYVVRVVANGRDGLKYLRSTPEICLIVLDLSLPGITGRSLREMQLRDRSLAWIPVVVVSGGVEAGRDARELEARSFVRKPIDVDELRTAMRRVGCLRASPRMEQRKARCRGTHA
jgi:CheY-like chemotaxis protein